MKFETFLIILIGWLVITLVNRAVVRGIDVATYLLARRAEMITVNECMLLTRKAQR